MDPIIVTTHTFCIAVHTEAKAHSETTGRRGVISIHDVDHAVKKIVLSQPSDLETSCAGSGEGALTAQFITEQKNRTFSALETTKRLVAVMHKAYEKFDVSGTPGYERCQITAKGSTEQSQIFEAIMGIFAAAVGAAEREDTTERKNALPVIAYEHAKEMSLDSIPPMAQQWLREHFDSLEQYYRGKTDTRPTTIDLSDTALIDGLRTYVKNNWDKVLRVEPFMKVHGSAERLGAWGIEEALLYIYFYDVFSRVLPSLQAEYSTPERYEEMLSLRCREFLTAIRDYFEGKTDIKPDALMWGASFTQAMNDLIRTKREAITFAEKRGVTIHATKDLTAHGVNLAAHALYFREKMERIGDRWCLTLTASQTPLYLSSYGSIRFNRCRLRKYSGTLSILQEIELQNCDLANLGDLLSCTSNLQRLVIGGTLKALPDTIRGLKTLKQLDISNLSLELMTQVTLDSLRDLERKGCVLTVNPEIRKMIDSDT